ncbi:hypothetical protein [Acinetobacter sp. ANC 4641]|nr:hypothetical protein E0H78_13220 [Acinetobacter sp. ANC 4641]
MKYSVLLSILIGCLLPTMSQTHANPVYSVNILNRPWNCSFYNGYQVPIYLDPSLNNVGVAGNTPPHIVLNPVVMNQFSPTMQIFWLAHECVHATYQPVSANENQEMTADCIAIKQLRQLNLSPREVNEIAWQTLPLLGSTHTGHLPGPLRAQHIMQCYMSP